MWDEITYPFPNVNGAAVEVGERMIISSQILLDIWLLIHVIKGGPGVNSRVS